MQEPDRHLQGELEHRTVKGFYPRTSKNKFQKQIANHQQRQRILRKIRLRTQSLLKGKQSASELKRPRYKTAALDFEDEDPLPYTSPTAHHHISETTRHAKNITAWLTEHQGDPATMVSMTRFKP